MKRYFFDVVTQGQAVYDYHGSEFTTAQKAYQLAELIALDIVVKSQDEFCEQAVYVRTEEGHTLFSIPVRGAGLAAALISNFAVSDNRGSGPPRSRLWVFRRD